MLNFERRAYELLVDPLVEWKSLRINYHKPFVNRLYIDTVVDGKECRISLHEIETCERSEALLHPHPWKAHFKVYDGIYRMDMGLGVDEPRNMHTMTLTSGSEYEMDHPNEWHRVYPSKMVMSMMVSYDLYGDKANKHNKKADIELTELSLGKQFEMKERFKRLLWRSA